EVGLAEDAAQRRLGEETGGVEVVLHVHDRLHRVYDAEVDDGVDLQADVVLGDDVLGRHVQHHRAQADTRHPVDGPGDEDESGPLGLGQKLPEAEDDPPLVLVEDLHREKDPEDDDENDDARSHHGSFRTLSVRPSTAATVTVCPAGTGESATARHRSPWTCTQPCGSSGVAATPISPTMADAPVRGGRRWA